MPRPSRVENPFRVEVVHCYQAPQSTTYVALHNDYSEDFVSSTDIPEDRCGEIAVKRLVEGNRGHYGPLEHSAMTLALRVDHNTMVQLRTHRVGLSFDVQSLRYTGQRIEQLAEMDFLEDPSSFVENRQRAVEDVFSSFVENRQRAVEDVFYIRPSGTYRDRQGKSFEWTEDDRALLAQLHFNAACDYNDLRKRGVAEELARYVLPTSYFQNIILTGNIRSWLHLLDVRLKADAQQEIRWAMELVAQQIKSWIPEIYAWYEKTRSGRAILSP